MNSGFTVLPGADDVLGPFERRSPAEDKSISAGSGVETYSIEQAAQVQRILPIKLCVYPELYLSENAREYMPRDFKEDEECYNIRSTRALSRFERHYSYYVDVTVGTALRRGVIYDKEAAKEWQEFFENVNLEGESITSYTKTAFTSAINGGVAGIFAEYPKQNENDSQQVQASYRPYFVLKTVEDVLEVRASIGPIKINGVVKTELRPTYLRVKSEKRSKSLENEHFEEVVPTVVVYDIPGAENQRTPDEPKVRVRTYSKKPNTETYEEDGEPYFLSIGYIPFSPIYGGLKEGFFVARPLHFDIARLNLAHWANCADIDETLHLNSSPIRWATGIRAHEDIYGGPGRTMISENENAKFGTMRGDMAGAEVALKRLEGIEKAMSTLAAVAIAPSKTQAESGFTRLLDRAPSDSQLAVLVGQLQDSLNRAIWYASGYQASKYPETKVTLSKNFIPQRLHSQQMLAFSNIFKDAQAIDLETYLNILDAGELFDGIPGFNVKDLIKGMGLTGKERWSQLQPDDFVRATQAKTQNTVDEGSGGAIDREVAEMTVDTGMA